MNKKVIKIKIIKKNKRYNKRVKREMTKEKIEREEALDIMKIIGIFLIILAHSGLSSKSLLFQIRTFDVPLLVFVSGVLAEQSYKKEKSLFQYYKKRIYRLLVPTYIFLIMFFAVFYLLGLKLYEIDVIKNSFLLKFSGNIGYIWIIRVYLLCTLAVPLIVKLKDSVNKYIYFSIIILSFLCFEISCRYRIGYRSPFGPFFIFDFIVYGCVMAIAAMLYTLKKREIYIITGIFGCMYFAMLYYLIGKRGGFVGMQSFKYPPRLYYTAYGIFASLILYIVASTKLMKKICAIPIINFISKSTLWIYFWHIFYLKILSASALPFKWYIRYAVLLIYSIGTTYIQNRIMDSISPKYKKITKFFRG